MVQKLHCKNISIVDPNTHSVCWLDFNIVCLNALLWMTLNTCVCVFQRDGGFKSETNSTDPDCGNKNILFLWP